ncbi:MAG: hypothetical protein Q4D14_02400 [Bacteroidales bacterium]|nr:hypothetical protein [Bacteroidales bacterium]
MEVTTDINRIYEELTARYDRISISTIKGVLKGIINVKSGNAEFRTDKTVAPRLEEAEDAFKKYNCAIFTAFRGGYTLEENLERNAQLKADMEQRGMAFRPVNGCYREAEWEYPCVEYCFFVYNADKSKNKAFFEHAYQLSAKYDQDSFLYKRAGINRTAFLVATTDAGRKDLKGDIKFAGQLYLDVPDVEAWTDCSDGRFAFQLKGMVLIGTGNKKVKIGEGNVLDIDGYQPDGILVLCRDSQQDLVDACHAYEGSVPFVQHIFSKDSYTPEYIHDVIFRSLKKLRDQKCKQIGIHCSVAVNGSATEGAAAAYDAIKLWAKRYDKKFEWIVLADTYGEYGKLLDDNI